jgi:hypothetical protein
VVNRDLQTVSIPELFTLVSHVIFQEDIDNIREVRTMERDTDEEGPHMEDEFALGEGDFALVSIKGGTDFAENNNKTVEGTRWVGDDECLNTIVEEDAKLRVFGKILVSCSDMAF